MFTSKRGKLQLWGNRNRKLDKSVAHSVKSVVAENQQNWIDCIRSGDTPNASVDMAHRTATAIHLGNLATRLRRTLTFDPQTEQIVGDAEAAAMLGRTYRDGGHWGVPAMV